MESMFMYFPNPNELAGCHTRSILKRGLTGFLFRPVVKEPRRLNYLAMEMEGEYMDAYLSEVY